MQNSRINAVETERCQSHLSPKRRTAESSRMKESSDQDYPDSKMHMGMIMGMKTFDNLSEPAIHALEEMQKKQAELEENNELMKTSVQYLLNDNKTLNNQLKVASARNIELQRLVDASSQNKAEQVMGDRELLGCDKSVQISSVCDLCQGKLEKAKVDDSCIILKKSEFDKLEHDMKLLRDEVVEKEQFWQKLIEREKMYRQQITDLSLEVVTNRHHLECRNSELQHFGQELVNKKMEVQELKREVSLLKKQMGKLKSKFVPKNVEAVESTASGLIEDIKDRLDHARNVRVSNSKSNTSFDKSQTGSVSSSQQTTPRGSRRDKPMVYT